MRPVPIVATIFMFAFANPEAAAEGTADRVIVRDVLKSVSPAATSICLFRVGWLGDPRTRAHEMPELNDLDSRLVKHSLSCLKRDINDPVPAGEITIEYYGKLDTEKFNSLTGLNSNIRRQFNYYYAQRGYSLFYITGGGSNNDEIRIYVAKELNGQPQIVNWFSAGRLMNFSIVK